MMRNLLVIYEKKRNFCQTMNDKFLQMNSVMEKESPLLEKCQEKKIRRQKLLVVMRNHGQKKLKKMNSSDQRNQQW